MPNQESRDTMARKMTAQFMSRIKGISINLYAEREDVLCRHIHGVFDSDPAFAAIVAVPADMPSVRPTAYMVYREARFVLDSDYLDDAALAETWRKLYAAMPMDSNRQRLLALDTLNATARQRITECKHMIMDAVPEFFGKLALDKYEDAGRFADEICLSAERTAAEIIKSYSYLAQHAS